MPKVFYTEKDIEDMAKRGILTLELNDDVVLTDLAYEKANRLGFKLIRDKPENPPAAPVRPYLSQQPSHWPLETPSHAPAQPAPMPTAISTSSPKQDDLHERIRSAVISRMGNQVDAALLDTIIQRVMASTGVK